MMEVKDWSAVLNEKIKSMAPPHWGPPTFHSGAVFWQIDRGPGKLPAVLGVSVPRDDLSAHRFPDDAAGLVAERVINSLLAYMAKVGITTGNVN